MPARRVILAYFIYSLVWIAAVAYMQLSGAMATFGDAAYLVFGIACALPAWAIAFASRSRREIDAQIYLFLTMFIQMALGSHLFFRKFGLTYRFGTTVSLAGSPLFLYPLTVAYFTTYYTMFRLVLGGAGPLRRSVPVRALVAYATAFAETLFMCNDVIAPYFSYTPRAKMLYVGSIAYGILFFFTIPSYLRILDERAKVPTPPAWRLALWDNAVALLAYAIFSLFV